MDILLFSDNTAWILTRRNSYNSLQKSVYHVPVVISDGDFPMQSSTNTLTVRVCTCDREGNMKLCNAEALTARAGLSTGALVAILLCVIILLSECNCRKPPGNTPAALFCFFHLILIGGGGRKFDLRFVLKPRLRADIYSKSPLAGVKETVLYFTP